MAIGALCASLSGLGTGMNMLAGSASLGVTWKKKKKNSSINASG